MHDASIWVKAWHACTRPRCQLPPSNSTYTRSSCLTSEVSFLGLTLTSTAEVARCSVSQTNIIDVWPSGQIYNMGMVGTAATSGHLAAPQLISVITALFHRSILMVASALLLSVHTYPRPATLLAQALLPSMRAYPRPATLLALALPPSVRA